MFVIYITYIIYILLLAKRVKNYDYHIVIELHFAYYIPIYYYIIQLGVCILLARIFIHTYNIIINVMFL